MASAGQRRDLHFHAVRSIRQCSLEVRTDKLTAAYPADAPTLREQNPYLWRLSGFGSSGRPMQDSRYGFDNVSFPAADGVGSLTASVASLKAPGPKFRR